VVRCLVGRQGEKVLERLSAVTIAFAMVVSSLSVQASDYVVRAGDVLEVSVAGIPELRQRVPVELSGEASFALAGELQADGVAISQLREKLKALLSKAVYRARQPGAGERAEIIKSEEVSLRVAEYRPIYLNGDIAKPGEIAYRPRMTVRQALAVAGGYDILRSGGGGSPLIKVELQGQLDALMIAFGKESARAWRLRNALGQAVPIDRTALAGLSPDTLAKSVDLAAEHMRSYKADLSHQKAYLTLAINQTEQRVRALALQASNEEAGAKLDEADAERVGELYRKGVVPVTRVTEVRRAALLASSRFLQTTVAAHNASKDLEEFRSRLQRSDGGSRIELLKELEDSHAALESLRVQIEAAKQKLALHSAARRSLIEAPAGELRISVFRASRESSERIVGSEQTELLPGDVVEVDVRVDTARQ
jgi:polysaccharide export outer membrane protein